MVKKVDAYKICEILGNGRYGQVYRAQNEKTKQIVAIKVIKKQAFSQCRDLEGLIMNQIQLITHIKPSLYYVRFIEFLKTQRNYYFVYEYCNQGTLRQQIMRCGTIPEVMAKKYFKDLIYTFKQLTASLIVHRRIYSSSILIHNGILKVTNFQLATSYYHDLKIKGYQFPIYMPPEVIKGGKHNQVSQIWSLGIVFYEILCGLKIYEDQFVQKYYTYKDIFIPQDVKISAQNQKLLKSMLAYDPAKRITKQELFSLYIEKEYLQTKFSQIRIN